MKNLIYIDPRAIPAAVDAINIMEAYANKIGPEIFRLLHNEKIGKSTLRPPKKIAAEIDALCAAAPERCRFKVNYTNGNIWLEYDNESNAPDSGQDPDGPHTRAYYRNSFCVGHYDYSGSGEITVLWPWPGGYKPLDCIEVFSLIKEHQELLKTACQAKFAARAMTINPPLCYFSK